VSNNLVVGLDGRGEVFVAAGTLNTFSTSLGGDPDLNGTTAGSGEMVVGNAGTLNTDFLYAGVDAPGTLLVEAGGAVTSEEASIGLGSAAGIVDVSGVNASGERSRFFATDTIQVGLDAVGTLRVRDGASVTTNRLDIGRGSSATVTVGGQVTQGFDAELTASEIVVGGEGSQGASLEIVSGGAVEANRFFVGSQGSTGFARVAGQATLTVRAAGFAGNCDIAINGSAEGSALAILEGGQVECDQASIGLQGQGTVFVGNNGGAPAPSRLVVSRVLKVGEGDVGTLQLAAGEVDAVDAASSPPADPFDIDVLPQGTVMGTGFLFGSVGNLGEIAAGVNCVPSCPRVPGPPDETGELLGGPAGGSLQIGGLLVMEPSATLAIPLAGADSTDQGRLRIVPAHGMDGSAALAGTLRLDFQNGYAPHTGDTFLLLDAASATGSFSTTEVTGLAPGWQFEITIVNGTVVLNSLSDGVPTTPAEPGAPAPASLVLHAPAPNPSGGVTSLRYELREVGRVRLAVYDALGREVAMLVDAERPAGAHEATFHAGRLSPGVYVLRLVAGGASVARSIAILR
jgi:hypothetical protein